MSETKLKLAAGTNVGNVRKNNEDNFVVCPDLTTTDWTIPQGEEPLALGKYGSLLVVADGMGGANAGEVASAIAVESIQDAFRPELLEEVVKSDDAILRYMEDAVKVADLNILKRSKEDESTKGMGTTIVMAWILGEKAYICWCGDSRCYVFNPNVGLTQLSKDHSYVQELVDKGELSAENAFDHPYGNIITQCLGDAGNRANPDTRIYTLQNDDTILLCSDGLSSLCRDEEILDVLVETHADTPTCKNALIQAALDAGGHDNVTVTLGNVTLEGDGEPADGDDENAEGEPKQEKAKNELQSTIPISSRKKFFRGLLLIVLALLVGAGTYICLSDNCAELRTQIATAYKQVVDYFAQRFS